MTAFRLTARAIDALIESAKTSGMSEAAIRRALPSFCKYVDTLAVVEILEDVWQRCNTTRESFEQLIGISRDSLTAWRVGRRHPNKKTIDDIITRLGVRLKDYELDMLAKIASFRDDKS